jgi:hypothetical protein
MADPLLLALALSILAQAQGPALAVDVAADRHSISPDIYGMNSYGVSAADAAFHVEVRVPVTRMGGDGASRYNWKVDASNSGFDWYFMAGSGTSTPVPNATADGVIALAESSGGRALLTIPMVPYINKGSAWDCSYPKSQFPDQQSWNPYVHPNGDDCGNGVRTDGGSPIPLTNAQVLRIHIPNSPALATEWVQYLVGKHGTADQGGVRFYNLDNEPSGWSNTHRDILPTSVPYTGPGGITDLGIQFATAVKAADPSALILGPLDFGYPVYSAAAGYLDAMKQAEVTAGRRLLDYLDEHYYPASTLGALANTNEPGSPELQAQRLRSTRSLWDATYSDESWIGQYNPPIQLIPYFKSLIAAHYPGTRLAISEYNWGALQSINGALAQADVLGIFGREGVDLATLWGPPGTSDAVAYAFRIYRNYDGQGSGYGETWVRSTSGGADNSGQDALALYGAQRTSDGALTLVVVNKTASDLTSSLTLASFTPAGAVQVWSYAPANLTAVVRQANRAATGASFTVTFPASSITLLVVASATTVAPPDAGTPDAGAQDAGPLPGQPAGGDTAVRGVSCTSVPGPWSGLSLLGLLVFGLSRPRGRVSRPPRCPRG